MGAWWGRGGQREGKTHFPPFSAAAAAACDPAHSLLGEAIAPASAPPPLSLLRPPCAARCGGGEETGAAA